MAKFNLCYDRAGRSEGVAFVTYQYRDDATTAIQEFDGANANGKGSRHPSFATSRQVCARQANILFFALF